MTVKALRKSVLNVQVDHAHMVVVIPPKYAVARVVQYIKSWSERSLRRKFLFWEKSIYPEDACGLAVIVDRA